MMPFIEEFQIFGEMNYYKLYQILRHYNLNEAARIVVGEDCGKQVFNSRNRSITTNFRCNFFDVFIKSSRCM